MKIKNFPSVFLLSIYVFAFAIKAEARIIQSLGEKTFSGSLTKDPGTHHEVSEDHSVTRRYEVILPIDAQSTPEGMLRYDPDSYVSFIHQSEMDNAMARANRNADQKMKADPQLKRTDVFAEEKQKEIKQLIQTAKSKNYFDCRQLGKVFFENLFNFMVTEKTRNVEFAKRSLAIDSVFVADQFEKIEMIKDKSIQFNNSNDQALECESKTIDGKPVSCGEFKLYYNATHSITPALNGTKVHLYPSDCSSDDEDRNSICRFQTKLKACGMHSAFVKLAKQAQRNAEARIQKLQDSSVRLPADRAAKPSSDGVYILPK